MNDLIQWDGAKYWNRAWNPIIGCRKCSPACANCYAAALVEGRFKQSFLPHVTNKENPPRRGVVFCGNMTDLFGEWLDEDFLRFDGSVEYIKRSLGYSDRAVYLWLTKRVKSMCDALNNGRVFLKGDDDCDYAFRDCEMRNQFFGFTAENQEMLDERLLDFRCFFPAWANGWISAEPLLGPLDLRGLECVPFEKQCVKWLVVGSESGDDRRPCDTEWVRDIVAQCRFFGIPVFVKQLEIGGRCERDISKFPEDLRIRQIPWGDVL